MCWRIHGTFSTPTCDTLKANNSTKQICLGMILRFSYCCCCCWPSTEYQCTNKRMDYLLLASQSQNHRYLSWKQCNIFENSEGVAKGPLYLIGITEITTYFGVLLFGSDATLIQLVIIIMICVIEGIYDQSSRGW
jgi:hypothetical protein